MFDRFHNIALSDKKYPYLICYFKFSLATKQRFYQYLGYGRPLIYLAD